MNRLWRPLAAVIVIASLSSCATETAANTDLRGRELRQHLLELADALGDAASAKTSFSTAMNSMDERNTVREVLEFARPHADRYQDALKTARAARSELVTLVQAARSGGYADELRLEAELVDELITEWRMWLDAEDYQNRPDQSLCVDEIDDLDQSFESAMSDIGWQNCFLEFLSNPIVQRGSFDAAERLIELGGIVEAARGS